MARKVATNDYWLYVSFLAVRAQNTSYNQLAVLTFSYHELSMIISYYHFAVVIIQYY